MKNNVEFIAYAVKQAKAAEKYGFTRNECCGNLKTAIHQYWQYKELGIHSLSKKKEIPRSEMAKKVPLSECVIEHSVPQMVIVNMLMDMDKVTGIKVKNILKKYYAVALVTFKENKILGAKGLRSKMPDDWDKKDLLARYKKVGINIKECLTSRCS
ncbi:hypothetical protein ACFLR7_04450 [Acidobacteriota bacterium]